MRNQIKERHRLPKTNGRRQPKTDPRIKRVPPGPPSATLGMGLEPEGLAPIGTTQLRVCADINRMGCQKLLFSSTSDQAAMPNDGLVTTGWSPSMTLMCEIGRNPVFFRSQSQMASKRHYCFGQAGNSKIDLRRASSLKGNGIRFSTCTSLTLVSFSAISDEVRGNQFVYYAFGAVRLRQLLAATIRSGKFFVLIALVGNMIPKFKTPPPPHCNFNLMSTR